jgi:hypothetical protein
MSSASFTTFKKETKKRGGNVQYVAARKTAQYNCPTIKITKMSWSCELWCHCSPCCLAGK